MRSLAGEMSASGNAGVGGIGLVAVQAQRRLAFERIREQVHLAVGCLREHVHELHGPPFHGWSAGRPSWRSRADRRRQVVEHAQQQVELSARLAVAQQAQARDELAEDVGVRPRLADRIDDRPASCSDERAVGAREVVVLEEGRRRQHDVGIEARVGEHLLEDDGEEILALQALQHALLVGHRHGRVAVVDEQQLDRRIHRLGEHAPELVHVDGACRARARSPTCGVMPQEAELLIA